MKKVLKEAAKSSVLVLGNENKLLSTAISALLLREDFVDSVVTAERFEDAYSLIDSGKFTVILIFAENHISSLLPRLSRIQKYNMKVLLVLGLNERFVMKFSKEITVSGLLSVASSFSELIYALKVLDVSGLKYISPHLITSIEKLPGSGEPFSHLSKKEFDVAVSITRGKRNLEIANEISISQKTVSTYKARLFKKLDITNSAQLISYMYEMAPGLCERR